MIKTLPFLLIISLIIGCGGYKMEVVKNELAIGQPEKAYDHLQKNPPKEPKLPFLFELGQTARYANRLTESSAALAKAEEIAEDLYTTDVTDELISIFTNDLARSYPGTQYERLLNHYYRALNYYYQNQLDGALVECRRATALINYFKRVDEKYDFFGAAFLAYFSGMLFEAAGEWNDALISYKQAAEYYKNAAEKTGVNTPEDIGHALLRLTNRLGFTDEFERYRDQYGEPPEHSENYGELILFYESGYVPEKREANLTFPILKSDPIAKGKRDKESTKAFAWTLLGREGKQYSQIELEYLIRVAIPTMHSNRPYFTGIEVQVDTTSANGVLVEDVEKIAIATLESGRGVMLLRTLIRALGKYWAFREVNERNRILGIIANLFAVATEQADTRSWQTLPNQIFMVRMPLPAGTHTLKYSFLGANGQVRRSVPGPDIEIYPNQITFLNHRTYE